MVSVPLNGMCSNMCARPVLPIGSCTDPASTCVKNENTGASGRSQTITVRPLASFLTVVRFSKEARSWLKESEQNTKQTATVSVKRNFILPPQHFDPKIRSYVEAGKLVKRCRRENGPPCGCRATLGFDWRGRPAPHHTRRSRPHHTTRS